MVLSEAILGIRRHVLLGQFPGFVAEVDSCYRVDPPKLGHRVADQFVVRHVDESTAGGLRSRLHDPLNHSMRLVAPVASDFGRVHVFAEHAPTVGHHTAKGGDGHPGIAVGLHDRGAAEHLEQYVEVFQVTRRLEHPGPGRLSLRLAGATQLHAHSIFVKCQNMTKNLSCFDSPFG